METHSLLDKDHGYPTISVKATLGVVYIARDPLDVVVSAADHYGLTIDQAIEMMADHLARGRGPPGNTVHQLMGSWSDPVRSWTGWQHTPMILLRSDDMLAYPFGQTGVVARKLVSALDTARLRPACHASPFQDPPAQ